MDAKDAEVAFDMYVATRKKFIEAGDALFGPGFLSMANNYFMKKKGHSPFEMLFSKPRTVYDEWVWMFKGEGPVKKLLEKATWPDYVPLLGDIKNYDGLRVERILQHGGEDDSRRLGIDYCPSDNFAGF